MAKPFDRRIHKLNRVSIDEISAVDAPCNPHAMILIAKSRTGADVRFGFDPILLRKRADADEEPDNEENDGGETLQDEEDETNDEIEQEAKRRNRTKQLRKSIARRCGLTKNERQSMKRILKGGRDFSNGQSGGISYSESDRPGAEDTRSAPVKASDLENVAAAAQAKPPAAGERFEEWLDRVYGDQVENLDPAELRLARRLFDAMRTATVLKRRADEAIDVIVRKRMQADPSKTYHQHWAATMQANPSLYSALRQNEEFAKADANHDFGALTFDGVGTYDMIDNGFGGGADTRTALDVLNAEADEIQKRSLGTSKPLTKAQSFVQAAKANPELYEKYKREIGR